MKARLLSAAAAAVLVVGSSVAMAQNGGGAGGGHQGGGMQDGMQGGGMGGQGGGMGGGACPPDQVCPGAGSVPDNGTMENGAAQAPAEGDQLQQGEARQPAQGQQQDQAGAGEAGGKHKKQLQNARRQNNTGEEPATTGSVRAPAEITSEERPKVVEAFHHEHLRPVTHIDFDINIGVAVPSTIVLSPIPADVVAVVPGYEGYEYFVTPDGVIVIVDPGTLQIVYVLSA